MIYELEKVELYGISWLNYSVIYLILTILLIILTVLWFKTVVVNSSSKLDEDCGCFITVILMVLTLISAVVTFMMATSGNYRSNTVPLSSIDNKITVNGEKVVIDELDESYGYHEYSNDDTEFGKRKANRDSRQIFKFEYSDLYESGKLIKENGSYYNLSKEDIKYLKGKGVK